MSASRLVDAVAGVRRAKYRQDLIEGKPVETGPELDPRLLKNLLGIERFLSDPDPALADFCGNIETEISRGLLHDLEVIEARLDRLQGVPRRRHATWRIIDGGRS